jgi:hypothetical protein
MTSNFKLVSVRPGRKVAFYSQTRPDPVQIEFLFRDAKNFAGLENCQPRSVNKINFHVNASLTTSSLAKAHHYLPVQKGHRESFSMPDVKTKYFKQYITDIISSKLAPDMSCKKNRLLYYECLSIGWLAA